jgi:hypothetical protein
MGIFDKLLDMLSRKVEKTTLKSVDPEQMFVIQTQEPPKEVVPETPQATVTINKGWQNWPTNQPLPSTTPAPPEYTDEPIEEKRFKGKMAAGRAKTK